MIEYGDSGSTVVWLGSKHQLKVIGSGSTFGARQKRQCNRVSGTRVQYW